MTQAMFDTHQDHNFSMTCPCLEMPMMLRVIAVLPLTVSTRERFPVAASHTLSVLSLTAVITC